MTGTKNKIELGRISPIFHYPEIRESPRCPWRFVAKLRGRIARRMRTRFLSRDEDRRSPDYPCTSSRNRRDRSPPWLLASEEGAGVSSAIRRGGRARTAAPGEGIGCCSRCVMDSSDSQGSTITSTNAGKLSAPFLSVTRSLNRNSLGSETDGATNEALGMLRSNSGTFAPRTWLQA